MHTCIYVHLQNDTVCMSHISTIGADGSTGPESRGGGTGLQSVTIMAMLILIVLFLNNASGNNLSNDIVTKLI